MIPNVAICETARKLNKLDNTFSVNKFMARGYSNILIGLKLYEIFTEQSSLSSNLKNYQIQQLEWITDQIKENPQNDSSISKLCKKTGTSVSMLQPGFKENMTVQ